MKIYSFSYTKHDRAGQSLGSVWAPNIQDAVKQAVGAVKEAYPTGRVRKVFPSWKYTLPVKDPDTGAWITPAMALSKMRAVTKV